MKIDKINSYNFNISTKKPVSKKEKAGFNQSDYATLPLDSKYWQAISFKADPFKAEVRKNCLKRFSDEQFDKLYSLAKEAVDSKLYEDYEFAEIFQNCFSGCFDNEKNELKEKNITLARTIIKEMPQWMDDMSALRYFKEEKTPSLELLREKLPDFKDKNFIDYVHVIMMCTNNDEFDEELYQRTIEKFNTAQDLYTFRKSIHNCSQTPEISKVIKKSEEIFGDFELALHYAEELYEICYEDKDEPDENRIRLLKEMCEYFPDLSDIYACNELLDINECIKYAPCELLNEKLHKLDGLKGDISFEYFLQSFDLCDDKDGFDDDLYQKAIILANCSDCFEDSDDMFEFMYLLKTPEDIDSLDIDEKFKYLNQLSAINSDLAEKLNLSPLITKLQDAVSNTPLNSVNEKDKQAAFKTLFASSKNGFSTFEAVLKDSVESLKTYKDGLALKYSRDEFLSDLDKLNLDNQTLSKLSIEPIYEDDKLTGYNGFIMLDKIDKESELYKICHKFLYENEIQTDNKELNSELNKIIKAIPEFINVIGKNQHATHNYSLDIHSLLVLANSIDNPSYKNLNAADKAILKTVCLLHDLTKEQGVVDKEHPKASSVYVKAILARFFKNEEALDRASELTKNHHWLKELSEATMEEDYRQIAFCFRKKHDFELAKIMADSDLKSVSDDFYSKHRETFSKADKIEKLIQNYYETGNALFSDIPSKNCLEEQNYNGYSYKVLNFNEMDNNNIDLSYLGFDKGKTKDDIRFLVHMVHDDGLEKDLQTLDFLNSSANEMVLSESIISPNSAKTYQDRKYGVILSNQNTNIALIAPSNIGSSYKKSYEHTAFLVSELDYQRRNFEFALLDSLRIDCSSKEYADFYKNHLAEKTRLSQIKDGEIFELGNKTFSGLELKEAISDFQNSLLGSYGHNEIVGCAPKIKGVIAKAKSLDEVPKKLLEFARTKDLPVVLI